MFSDKSIYEKKNITVGNDIRWSRTHNAYLGQTTKGSILVLSETQD